MSHWLLGQARCSPMFCSFWACLSFLAAWYLCCNHAADKIISIATISNPEGTQLYVHLSRRFFCYFFPIHSYLVGGLEHFLFPHILGISSSQLTKLIFFRGVGQPPTSHILDIYQYCKWLYDSHITTLPNTHYPIPIYFIFL